MAVFSPVNASVSSNQPISKGSNSFMPVLIENLPVAIYTCDINGYITSYNKAAVKLWGREPEIGKDLWCGSFKIFTTEGEPLPLTSCPMAIALKNKTAVEGEEIVVQKPDGTFVNVIPHPKPLFDSSGTFTGAINTLIDITQQRQEEKKDALLAAIVESSHDAIVSKTLDSIIQTWNKEAENMFGYMAEEVIGKHISLIIPPERISEEDMIIGKIKIGEKVDHFETVRMRKNGKRFDVSLTISPVKDQKGNIVGASKIARDITQQKQLEQQMLLTTKHLRIINSIAKTISENLNTKEILQKVTDATTQLVDAQFGAFFYNVANSKGESYMLYALAGASKEAFDKLGMPRKTEIFNTTFNGQGILRSDDITKDPRYGRNPPYHGMPEGHLPVVSYLAVPVFSKSGAVIGGLFYGHPEVGKFTEEHENLISGVAAQAGLALDNARLFEEVEALNIKKDEFIGLASHELKTPVTSVSGYLQILERTLPDNDNKKKALMDKAIQQVNKLSNLISDLLDISKIHTGKLPFSFSSFDLVSLLDEVREMMQQSKTTHKIELNCNQKELIIYADRQRIEQVIINLVSNAIKYSPGANRVIISCKRSGDTASVSVQDFGLGIDADEQKRIFERFYRVQGATNHISGLGIGLYISHEIINRHSGKFMVESVPGQGSTFTFEIPVSPQQ
ncbi:MAG: PAS domain S-box protein [Ilyomonas sp.]